MIASIMPRDAIAAHALLSLFCVSALAADQLGCRDDAGRPVDWYIVYKIPKLERLPPPFNTGYSYVYITSDNTDSWRLSDKLITAPGSIFGNTLRPFYATSDADPSTSYVLYNDQPPTVRQVNQAGSAHAKGFIGMNGDAGFWLIHSVPKFPPSVLINASYAYPPNAKENGQSAMCVSFRTAHEGDNIAQQLLTMRAKVYSYRLNGDVLASARSFDDVIAKKWIKKQPSRSVSITTAAGRSLRSFAKNAASNDDLYSELIAPELRANLFVETWRNGAGHSLSSECDEQFHVNNIERVRISVNHAPLDWEYTEDHAKWAISDAADNPYVCVGDINRMQSQFKRGGGSMCLENKAVWSVLRSSIEQIENCPKSAAKARVQKARAQKATVRTATVHRADRKLVKRRRSSVFSLASLSGIVTHLYVGR